MWEVIVRKCQTENTAKRLSGEYERFLDVDTIEANNPILRTGKMEEKRSVGGVSLSTSKLPLDSVTP